MVGQRCEKYLGVVRNARRLRTAERIRGIEANVFDYGIVAPAIIINLFDTRNGRRI